MKALIATGYGINCEREMFHACSLVGFEPVLMHTQTLLNEHIDLQQFAFITFPGGFSFGDELGAGKVFANRIAYAKQAEGAKLKNRLIDFVASGGCILGVCNGFQLLVKLGLLPGSLAHNDSGCFENRWVYHKVSDTPCVFTRGLTQLYLPIRHGEGKYITDQPVSAPLSYATVEGSITENYPENPNGSKGGVAAATDSTGRILGMMAHPEAALFFVNDPRWTQIREKKQRNGEALPRYGDGYALFYNVKTYLEQQ